MSADLAALTQERDRTLVTLAILNGDLRTHGFYPPRDPGEAAALSARAKARLERVNQAIDELLAAEVAR